MAFRLVPAASRDCSIEPEDLPLPLPAGQALGIVDLTVSLRDARRQFEREYIAAVLHRHRWSVSEAARTLGMERANLYRKVRQVGLVLPAGERVAGRRS